MDADELVRARLTDVWPPLAIRIRTERLVLRLPTDDDILAMIEVARAGIHPPDEMPFGVAWTDVPSPAFERGFVQHRWAARGGWSPTAWMLHLMVELQGKPIGAQSVMARDFATSRTVDTGSWLGRAWQGRWTVRDDGRYRDAPCVGMGVSGDSQEVLLMASMGAVVADGLDGLRDEMLTTCFDRDAAVDLVTSFLIDAGMVEPDVQVGGMRIMPIDQQAEFEGQLSAGCHVYSNAQFDEHGRYTWFITGP